MACFVVCVFLFVCRLGCALDESGFRNNEVNPFWGAAGSQILFETVARTGTTTPLCLFPANVSAREISNVLLGRGMNRMDHHHHNLLFLNWGLMVSHDILFTQSFASKTFSIPVPKCDTTFDVMCSGNATIEMTGMATYNTSSPRYSPVHVIRDVVDQSGTSICDSTRVESSKLSDAKILLDSESAESHINMVSSFIDGGAIYGHSSEISSKLRTFEGGQLKMTEDRLLPVYHSDLFSGPTILAGDPRTAANPVLVVLHTIFVREHNRKAAELSLLHPNWSDQQLYITAKRWVVSLLQKITEYEYIPSLLGAPLPIYEGYKSFIRPEIDAMFSLVAFRYGHSAIPDYITRINDEWRVDSSGPISMQDTMFDPNSGLEEGIEPVLRGAVLHNIHKVNLHVVSSLRNRARDPFWKRPRFDLTSITIQRARESGIPAYWVCRLALELHIPRSWPELVLGKNATDQDLLNNKEAFDIVERLKAVYSSVYEVDAWVGGLAEPNLPGSSLGSLFHKIITEQFRRVRDADRFWFMSPGVLSDSEMEQIQDMTLEKVLILNSELNWVPQNVFEVPIPNLQPIKSSESVNSITFTPDFSMKWQIVLDSEIELNGFTQGYGKRSAKRLTQESVSGVIQDGSASGEYFDGTIKITLTMRDLGAGWMAIGVGKDMVNCDTYVAFFDENGQPQVGDGYSAFYDPKPDTYFSPPGTHDVIPGSVEGSVIDGVYSISFSRKLYTGDFRDFPFIKGDMDVIYAWVKNVPGLPYHGVRNRGTVKIDFFSGSSKCNVEMSTTRILHGIVMFVSWCIIAPAGIIVARYFKYKDWWINAHETLQKLGSTGTVPLTVVILMDKDQHFRIAHHIIGFVLFMILFVSVLTGYLTKWGLKNKAHKNWHHITRKVHRWIGRCLGILGITNCVLGAQLLLNQAQLPLLDWILAVYIVFIVLLMGYLELTSRTLGSLTLSKQSTFTPELLQELPVIKWEDVNTRVGMGAKLVVIEGIVIDISDWLFNHPGGRRTLEEAIGTDVSFEFSGVDVFKMSLEKYRESKKVNKPKISKLKRTFSMSIVASRPQTHTHSMSAKRKLFTVSIAKLQDYNADVLMMPANAARRMKMPKVEIRSEGIDANREGKSELRNRQGSQLTPNVIVSQPMASQSRFCEQYLLHLLLHKEQINEISSDIPVFLFTFLIPWNVVNFGENLKILPGYHYTFLSSFNGEIVSRTYTPICISTDLLRLLVQKKQNQAISESHRIRNKAHTVSPTTSEKYVDDNFDPQDTVDINADLAAQREDPMQSFSNLLAKEGLCGESSFLLQFAIKLYPKGRMSRFLSSLKIGDVIRIKGPHGRPLFSPRDDKCWTQLYMIAGGSGLTPMLQLLNYHAKFAQYPCDLHLIFANRKECDIMMKPVLEFFAQSILQDNVNVRFQVTHVLSQPDPTWKGFSGRLDAELLKNILYSEEKAGHNSPLLDAEHQTNILFVICGPTGMAETVHKALTKDMGVPDNCIEVL